MGLGKYDDSNFDRCPFAKTQTGTIRPKSAVPVNNKTCTILVIHAIMEPVNDLKLELRL